MSGSTLYGSPELTANVGHHIVANDERCGHEEPDETFKNVIDDEVAGIVVRLDMRSDGKLALRPR